MEMSNRSLASLEMNFKKGSFAFTTESQVGTLIALLNTVHKSSSFLQHFECYHVDEFNYQTGIFRFNKKKCSSELLQKTPSGFDSHETKKLLCCKLQETEVIQILK